MPRHILIVCILTFITGFASGVYVFFINRGDSTQESEAPQIEKGFEIRATTYGGCERIGCISFQILDDGSYTYLAPNRERSYERFKDELTERQRDVLRELVYGADFEKLAQSMFSGTCPITYDGIAYRFDITRDGVLHTFDSCTQSLDHAPLVIEVVSYFAIMEAIHRPR